MARTLAIGRRGATMTRQVDGPPVVVDLLGRALDSLNEAAEIVVDDPAAALDDLLAARLLLASALVSAEI